MRYHDVVIPLGCAWSSPFAAGGPESDAAGAGAAAVIEVTDR
jgi:hypothetical protein